MNIKKKLNKILLFFILCTFVTSMTMGPFAVKTVDAATAFNPSKDLSCGWTSLDVCTAYLGYYMFYTPASGLLVVAGSIFDSMLAFTLSSTSINQPFVMDAWKTLRDIANISFIFVLLYIAIATILNLGNYKKLLTYLVVVALIINFSAFFTKIVIDASNIVAFGFYNAISVNVPSGNDVSGISVPEKRISQIFIKGFDPQRMMRSSAVQNWKKSGKGVADLFFVFFAAGIVTVVAAFVLFMAGFLMLGRMVAFWFLIIASPLAFVAYVIPGTRGLFSKWSSHLINQALVAPVFLFFMYIIANIVQSDFLKSIFNNTSDSTFDVIINIVLTFSVLLMTLLMALDVTKKLSGQAGALASKYAGGDRAVKMFKSGTRRAGRYASSRLAHSVSESATMKSFGRRHPGVGMAIDTTLDKAGAGKYGKYMKAREKRKAEYGDKVSGESNKDKVNRLRQEASIPSAMDVRSKAKVRLKEATKNEDAKEIEAAKKGIEIAKEKLELEKETLETTKKITEERKEAGQKEYAGSLENPGRVLKTWQKVTGEEIADREAAVKVRKGKGREDSKTDKIKKLIEEAAKEKSSESTPPPKDDNATK